MGVAYIQSIENPEAIYKIHVQRYNPEEDDKPHIETYEVPFVETMTVIEALEYLWDQGEYIAFRSNCREYTCGSCAMRINGRPQLACNTVLEDGMIIEPLSRYPVEKDLVAKVENDLERYKKLKLYPEGVRKDGRDKFTSELPEEFGRIFSRCVECNICLDGCPLSDIDPERFNGPMFMVQLARLHADPFDNFDRPKLASDHGLWQCTTCHYCADLCPNEIDASETIMSLRSERVEDGRIPTELIDAFRGAYKRGNPWGYPKSERAKWSEDLDIEVISDKSDILYFVGCAPSYDPRAQEVAKSLIALFDHFELEYGILGVDEKCCGNCILGMGEIGLFEFLRDENITSFNEHRFQKIVTTSPHCYNAFKNEYPDLNVEVEHYSQTVLKLMEEGKLNFADEIEEIITVTYHDPCYLGRHNGVYDPPREILENIPGVKLVEMDRNREDAVCCSGGGGGMWIEMGGSAGTEERLSKIRLREAMETGADILVTACPFCLLTFDEVAKGIEEGNSIQVKDLSEMVVNRLG